MEGPACPLLLLAALLRDKFAGEIGDVDLVQQVKDSICPVVALCMRWWTKNCKKLQFYEFCLMSQSCD
jgi:hypothetical protein